MDLVIAILLSIPLLTPVLSQSTNCVSGGSSCLIFDQQIYNISVEETNYPSNHQFSPILTTTCHAQNGEMNISYSLIKDGGLPFTIHPQTGEITPLGNLDYEETTSYSLTSVCTSMENPNITDSARVVINLLPVNEHRPGTFSTVSWPINCSTSLGPLEGLVHGVAYNVTDLDLPRDQLYFTLRRPSEYFSIDLLTGQISLNKAIVNVSIHFFHLRVIVCDIHPADTRCRSNLVLIIYSFKSFTIRSYTVNVRETAAIGTTLFSQSCNLNQDCSGPFTEGVQILNEATLNGKVSIEEDGRVLSRKLLDYETMASFNFTVSCFIRQTLRPFSLSFVTVNIEDVNEPPVCTNRTITLASGVYQTGHEIGQIECHDEDRGPNGELLYTVQGELPELGDGRLSLNSSTGVLSYSGNLFSTTPSSHNLILQVADSGSDPLVETVHVTLHLAGDGMQTSTSVETEALAATSAETEALTSTSAETEALTSTSVETEALTSTSAETEALAATSAETETLTSTSVETEALTSTSAETEALTSTSVETGALAATSAETEALAATSAETETLTSTSVETEALTSTSVETGALAATSAEAETLTSTSVETEALTSTSVETGALAATSTETEAPASSIADTESEYSQRLDVSTYSRDEGSLTTSQGVPMLVIIVVCIAGGIILICLVILLCLLCLYCYIKRKKANQKKFYLTSRKESVSRMTAVPNIYETGVQELNLHFTGSSTTTSGRSSVSGGSSSFDTTPSSSSVIIVSDTAIIINESDNPVTVSTFIGGEKQDEERTLVVLENTLATHSPDV